MSDVKLQTCARCGRLFSTYRSPVCAACEPEEERDYDRIRGVLRKTPGLKVEQAAELAQVELSCVVRMLKAGRIENASLGEPVRCGQCGGPAISVTRRLCEACLLKLEQRCSEAIRDVRENIKKDAKTKLKTDAAPVREAFEEKRAASNQELANVAKKRLTFPLLYDRRPRPGGRGNTEDSSK